MRALWLATALAIGCGNGPADCPPAVAASTSCASAGLTCFSGNDACTCTGGLWQCAPRDMGVPDMTIVDTVCPPRPSRSHYCAGQLRCFYPSNGDGGNSIVDGGIAGTECDCIDRAWRCVAQ